MSAVGELEKYKNRIFNVVIRQRCIGKIAERNGYFLWRTKTKRGRATGQDEAYKEVIKHGT